MTDEEIEKTLTQCGDLSDFNCKGCPLEVNPLCFSVTRENALDYINRLKAEKEQVRKDAAKEILQEVYKLCGNLVADNSPDSIDFMDFARAELLTDLCQKYGVEVDE